MLKDSCWKLSVATVTSCTQDNNCDNDLAFVPAPTGNWSPSDFPSGTSYRPYSDTQQSVNRDLLVVLSSPDIVNAFQTVYNEDWAVGTEWEPKY